MGKSWKLRTLLSALIVMFVVGSALMVSAGISVGTFTETADGDWEGTITVDGVTPQGDATILVFTGDGSVLDGTTIKYANQDTTDETGSVTFNMIIPQGTYTIRAGGTGVSTAMELTDQTIGSTTKVITEIETLAPISVLESWDLVDVALPSTVKVYYGAGDDEYEEISVTWDTAGKSIPAAGGSLVLIGTLDQEELEAAGLVFDGDPLYAQITLNSFARNVSIKAVNGDVIKVGSTATIKLDGFGISNATRTVGYAVTAVGVTPDAAIPSTIKAATGTSYEFNVDPSYLAALGAYKITVFIAEDGNTETMEIIIFVNNYLHEGTLKVNPIATNPAYTAMVLNKAKDIKVESSFWDYNKNEASAGTIEYYIQPYSYETDNSFDYSIATKLTADSNGIISKEQIASMPYGAYRLFAVLNLNPDTAEYDAFAGRTVYLNPSALWGSFKLNGAAGSGIRVNKSANLTLEADLYGYDKTAATSGVLYSYDIIPYTEPITDTTKTYEVWPPAGETVTANFADKDNGAYRLTLFAKYDGEETPDVALWKTVYLANSFVEAHVNVNVNGEDKGRLTLTITEDDDPNVIVSAETYHVPSGAEVTYLYEIYDYRTNSCVATSADGIADTSYGFDLSGFGVGSYYIKITIYLDGQPDVIVTRTIYTMLK